MMNSKTNYAIVTTDPYGSIISGDYSASTIGYIRSKSMEGDNYREIPHPIYFACRYTKYFYY